MLDSHEAMEDQDVKVVSLTEPAPPPHGHVGEKAESSETDKGLECSNPLEQVVRQLSSSALRHDEVAAIRDKAAATEASKGSQDADDEPPVTCRAERKAWLIWAKQKALLQADRTQPRKVHPDGSVEKLRFRSSPNEIFEAMGGIVPNVYLEFLKFCAGYCVLGLLISVPSIVLSCIHAHEVYSQTVVSYPWPMLV